LIHFFAIFERRAAEQLLSVLKILEIRLKKMRKFLAFLAIAVFAIGCGEDSTNNPGGPSGPASDLTRSGKFISFTSNFSGNYDIFLAQVNSAGVLDTANLVYTSNPFNLTSANTSDDKQSNWSPDGRVLVFSRVSGNQQEIYAYFFNADGSIDSTLNENPRRLFSSSGNWDNNPSFSPGGTNLVWDRREDNNSPSGVDTADTRDLYIGDVTGTGNSFQVADIRPISATTSDEYNPKWSPRISVRKVAYEYQSSATSTDHDVYVIDPFDPPNNVNFYNPNNSGYPAWAPECNRIIFESDKTSGNYWKISGLTYPASGNPVDIVDEVNVNSRYPTWLPNGGLLAYIRFSGNSGNIYIVSSSGGNSFKLLPAQFDGVNNLWPAW
jgi:WD40-like Beta Propeller Repeat